MVIHNYVNLYDKWNIFVAWPHLWLKLGTVKPEIMLCETVLNLFLLGPGCKSSRLQSVVGNAGGLPEVDQGH